jgi:hypothetical protein
MDKGPQSFQDSLRSLEVKTLSSREKRRYYLKITFHPHWVKVFLHVVNSPSVSGLHMHQNVEQIPTFVPCGYDRAERDLSAIERKCSQDSCHIND